MLAFCAHSKGWATMMPNVFLCENRKNKRHNDSCVCAHMFIHASVSLSLGLLLHKCAYFFPLHTVGETYQTSSLYFASQKKKVQRQLFSIFFVPSRPQIWTKFGRMISAGRIVLSERSSLTWKPPPNSVEICSRQ